jgi:hypothetical protein
MASFLASYAVQAVAAVGAFISRCAVYDLAPTRGSRVCVANLVADRQLARAPPRRASAPHCPHAVAGVCDGGAVGRIALSARQAAGR